jgi:hypothetical protein
MRHCEILPFVCRFEGATARKSTQRTPRLSKDGKTGKANDE